MVIKLKNLYDHIVMVTNWLYQVLTYLFPIYIGREFERMLLWYTLYICFRTPQVHIQVYTIVHHSIYFPGSLDFCLLSYVNITTCLPAFLVFWNNCLHKSLDILGIVAIVIFTCTYIVCNQCLSVSPSLI